MAGATIKFEAANAKNLSAVTITEFASNEDPIQVTDLEVAAADMNLNGHLVTWCKANPVQVSFSLIPFSTPQRNLAVFLCAMAIGGKGGTANGSATAPKAKIDSMTITIPNDGGQTGGAMSFTFKNGRLLQGPPAVGSNAEGRANSCTYTFIFESVSSSK